MSAPRRGLRQTSATPTRHPLDPGGMPSVPSSKLGKRTPHAAPRGSGQMPPRQPCRPDRDAFGPASRTSCLPRPHVAAQIPPWVFGPPKRGADPLLWLRRAARARGSACQRRQGRFPLTPLSARAILSRRIPAANVSCTIKPLFPASAVFAEIPPFRPPAFTVSPRQADIAQTATRTALPSGTSPSSNAWKSCYASLPIPGRFSRPPSEPDLGRPWTRIV